MECTLLSEIETLVKTGGVLRVVKKDKNKEAVSFTARVEKGVLVPLSDSVNTKGVFLLDILFKGDKEYIRYSVDDLDAARYGVVENEYHIDLVVNELYTQFKSHTGFTRGLIQKRVFSVRADWGWSPC